MATPIINEQVDLINSALNQVNIDLDSLNSALGEMPDKIKGIPKTDGYYEQMTVGNAEQLVSNVGIEDSVPYTFRTAGGSADIGDRETDKLVGGTIAWNQLIQNGNFADGTDGWIASNSTIVAETGGVKVYNGTSTWPGISTGTGKSISSVAGHKYMILITGYSENTNQAIGVNMQNGINDNVGTFTTTKSTVGLIKGATSSVTRSVSIFTTGQSAVLHFSSIEIFDLTLMFGSTIADYIYSLEQSQAGAGVAWFRKLFPKLYYPYNAGELIHVNASAHKMVGFNQWDEQWESGTINTSGQLVADPNYIRSKNYIPVLPNTGYFLKTGTSLHRIFFYDIDKNFISFGYSTSANGKLYTTPTNCYYVMFRPESNYGTTYKNDICINLHWDGERDGEYEPYEVHNYALDSDLVLRGIPKLDSANRLYYDGDTYESDGTVTRKYGIVDLGTLNWVYGSNVFSALVNGMAVLMSQTPIINSVCSAYPSVGKTYTTLNDKELTTNLANYSSSPYCIIKDSAYSDAATFKAAMSGVYLVYELATPTEEEADPYTNPQICSNWGTEEYVVTEQSGVAMPVGHDTFYQADLKAKLEMLPDSPDGDGDYIMRQTNGENAFIPLAQVKELPDFPTTDGNYKLRCTVSSGTATLTWVAE